MLSWELILICWYQPWEDFKFMYMYNTFCRAVKWKLKCLKQRRKAGDWELLKIWNRKFIFYLYLQEGNTLLVLNFAGLYVINRSCFHLPFFFWSNYRAEYSKKQKQYSITFVTRLKVVTVVQESVCYGLLWRTTKISRKEQRVMIEKTEDTTTSWHWELMR